ncbi:MAG: YraN family protein [Muribaculaceae bacterium]|nr:YraN family protein [Muribaculaceae bacterium]
MEEKRKLKKDLAREFGAFSEEMAAMDYIRKGYTVLERNWRLGKTEIDLIVQKDDTVAIVEVKARATNEADALNSVSTDKRKRMVKAADAYLRTLPGDMKYRFDVVACNGSPQNFEMEVVENAFVSADIF